jgi:tetratricopeptide (TPR) repeat protein
MRARLALAQTLHTLGRHEEALDHYRALLRLNAGDNQGVRYLLLTALLERGQDEEAGALLDAYEGDIQAIWPYGRALWLFRREGDSSRARAALKEAMQANPHVVGYLFDPDPIGWTPPHFALGSEEEAVYAAGELQDGFEGTPGALAWLRKQTASLHGRRRTAKRSRVRRKGRKNR